ncbi:uncharacterized protein PD653_3916 [Nocardioides sp. PD653]|nr:uncharacterized protein PD653B2_2109 [Nocardioides sp. PD653-B2]GAW56479.1 uncharacterized protein PD653_3916 [Nocardioides sp. PD653]
MSRLVAVVVALVAPVVAMTLLTVTGGLAAQAVPGLSDPGAFTRYGLPAAQALRDLGAAVTVGAWCSPRAASLHESPRAATGWRGHAGSPSIWP